MAKRAPAPLPAAEAAPPVESAPPPQVPWQDAEFKTKEQLKSEGYIPFGVSLAIAAVILLLTDARWPIVGWVTSYARFLGL